TEKLMIFHCHNVYSKMFPVFAQLVIMALTNRSSNFKRMRLWSLNAELKMAFFHIISNIGGHNFSTSFRCCSSDYVVPKISEFINNTHYLSTYGFWENNELSSSGWKDICQAVSKVRTWLN